MSDLPDHVRKNRAKWDDLAQEYAAAGETRLEARHTGLGHLARPGSRAAHAP